MAGDGPSAGSSFSRLQRLEEIEKVVEIISRSQRGYRELIDSLDELVFTLSLDGTLLAANRPVAALLGRAFPEFIGRRLNEFLKQPALPTEEQLKELLEKRYWSGVVQLQPRNTGTVRYFDCVLHTIIKGDKARAISGLARDITQQQEIERRFAELFETVQEGVYMSTPEGKVLDANPALVRLLGYAEKADLLGADINDFCAVAGQKLTADSAASDVAAYREIRLRRKDGCLVTCLSACSASRDFSGRIVRYQGTLVDITERKRAEEALRTSEQSYRDLFEYANDMVFTQDLAGNYTSLNQAGERITGYSRAEVLGMNFSDMAGPEYSAAVHKLNEALLAGKKLPPQELQITSKDGRRVALEVNARLIHKDGQPVGMQGIGRDITERKSLEDQLRQAQKMEAVGRLAGGVAHDFNNLLTVIIGSSDLILSKAPPDSPLCHHALYIKKASSRAAELTRQLLAFSRRQVLEPKVLDLNAVVEGIEKLLLRLIGEDIELITELAPKLPAVKADPTQIEQVLLNLAVNARDAMPHGGRLVIATARAELGPEYGSGHPAVQPGRYAMLAVSDTGCGMDAQTRAHAFEPFFTTKEQGRGTGLGLSTVYGIVKQSGGDITLESAPEAGTTFKVYLPAVEADVTV